VNRTPNQFLVVFDFASCRIRCPLLSVTSVSSSTLNWRWSHTSVELQVHASTDDCVQCGPAWKGSHRSSSLGIDPVEAGRLQYRPSTCTAASGYARHCPSRLWPYTIRPRHADTKPCIGFQSSRGL